MLVIFANSAAQKTPLRFGGGIIQMFKSFESECKRGTVQMTLRNSGRKRCNTIERTDLRKQQQESSLNKAFHLTNECSLIGIYFECTVDAKRQYVFRNSRSKNNSSKMNINVKTILGPTQFKTLD